jgi:hypothetical protein
MRSGAVVLRDLSRPMTLQSIGSDIFGGAFKVWPITNRRFRRLLFQKISAVASAGAIIRLTT